MARGGAGRGQGRKPGSRNKKTDYMLSVKDKALAAGMTPLEYVLREMREPIPSKTSVAQRIELRKLRMEAAKAALPYCHPKIAPKEEGAGGGKTPTDHADKVRQYLRAMDEATGGSARS